MSSQTATLIANKTSAAAKAGLDAAAVLADPPALANMVDLGDYRNIAAPLAMDVILVASEAADLTGAHYFAADFETGIRLDLGPVAGGVALALDDDKGNVETLERVAGVYSHIGIGGAVLSAGTLTIAVRMIEVQG